MRELYKIERYSVDREQEESVIRQVLWQRGLSFRNWWNSTNGGAYKKPGEKAKQ